MLHLWKRFTFPIFLSFSLTSSCLQIRVALKDWDEVLKFQQDLINAQHLDAAYVFQKLRLEKAFHFTAMPKLVCCPK